MNPRDVLKLVCGMALLLEPEVRPPRALLERFRLAAESRRMFSDDECATLAVEVAARCGVNLDAHEQGETI